MNFLKFLFAFLFVFPTLADDTAHTRAMMEKIRAEEWDEAKATARQASDPILLEIYNWYALRAGQGSFADYETFLKDNDDWPGLPWLQKAGEKVIPNTIEADRLIAFFEPLGIQSDDGLLALMRAYHHKGEHDNAQNAFNTASQNLAISAEIMAKISMLYPEFIDKYLYTHIDYLLFEDEADLANEHIDQLNGQEKAMALARIRILNNDDGIGTALNALWAENINNGGVAFDRFRYRLTHNNRSGAIEILLSQPTSRNALLRPEYWSGKREDIARSKLCRYSILTSVPTSPSILL